MSKGFTLLELIIVIGILAILGTVSVLVLNPAQLFAQARDTTRIQDLQTLNSALGLYVSSVSNPQLGNDSNCYTATSGVSANCGGRHASRTTTIDPDRTVDASGWIPVAFDTLPGGAPLSALPIDPINDTTYFYSYSANNTAKTYELDANLESIRYTSGTDNRESIDGGSEPTLYEIGTEPGLDI